ncbi:hypothetical protein AMELA_G00280510 [Ameiurus melas]|uniref:Sphingomyelin phosphodiesterase C-terminal domain-containing protein n=1 Tax=Ameiurus melas TaxID=219545 RepID=A0A7J5ZK59_AMEME|nr:hypothetical protein AMELA_G00280510 [Ameiurus melas]
MTKAFGITDIQPESLHELALKFEAPDSKEFQKYFTYFMVSYNDTVTCTEECKSIQVCSVHFLDHESYSECLQKVTEEEEEPTVKDGKGVREAVQEMLNMLHPLPLEDKCQKNCSGTV